MSCFVCVLAGAGEILRTNRGISVELAGHTDPREIATSRFPSTGSCHGRGPRQSDSASARSGNAPEHLAAQRYSDLQPVAPGITDEVMANNEAPNSKPTDGVARPGRRLVLVNRSSDRVPAERSTLGLLLDC